VKYLTVINDAPYGNERPYNALRLCLALAKKEDSQLKVFLMADGVGCARTGQVTAAGYYNIERMIRGCATRNIEIGCCGSCMDARGLKDDDLLAGTRRSSMAELADWTAWADKVLVW